jgi:SAM-dependent methyltransferase
MQASNVSPTPYDQVFYPPAAYPETHPDRLATVGTLRGMHPAPLIGCRLLELGCGNGENLIPLAFSFPLSEFVGLDSARHPVALGAASIAELGLTNIQLHPVDLCDAAVERFGSFNYIIAHGLYSWVPASTRERILALCRQLLTPHGIAYISYNAYPGNHLHDLARGIIRFHTTRCENPPEKVQRARAILKFLAGSRLVPNPYVVALGFEFARVVEQQDAVFFHDDLSDTNQPFYFHEFISAAHRHNLQFLGEAGSDELHAENFTADALNKLQELENEGELIREQYKDFLLGRAFRRTLLCRSEVDLAPAFLPERTSMLYASCDAKSVDRSGSNEAVRVLFRRPNGAELETNHRLVTASFRHLCSEWPCPVAFNIVLDHAGKVAAGEAGSPGSEDQTALLADTWIKGYQNGFLQLHVTPPRVVNKVSTCPECSALVRLQLRKSSVATSQLHRRVRLDDPLSREVAQLLDGSRDEDSITQIILESVKRGQAELRQNSEVVTDPDRVVAALKLQIREVFAALAREGLLIG